MSRNFIIRFSLALGLAVVLLFFPVMNSSASKQAANDKKIEEAAQPVAQTETETLHSELLFK